MTENTDVHFEDVAQLWDWGESSGTGPWLKLQIPVRDMPRWRGLKGSTYQITACPVIETDSGYDLDKEFVWRNEAQQLGFGETDSRGGWVKFRVEPEDLAFFRGRKDDNFYWKMILTEKVEAVQKKAAKKKADKGEFSHEVRDLHQAGFFKAPKLWEIVGTDAGYQSWTRKRPCIVTGGFDWDGDKGEERTEYAHVRRSGDAGTGHKPPFSGVPLCHEIHANYQHQHGETAAYAKYLERRNSVEGVISPLAAKEWFEKKALENVEKWAHEMTLHAMNKWLVSFDEPPVDSLTKVHPRVFRGWATGVGLQNFLPTCYKEVK